MENFVQKLIFWLTVLFLAILAIVIQYLQIHNDIEQLPYLDQAIDLLLIIYPIFILERVIFIIRCHIDKKATWKTYAFALSVSLFPPLRFAAKRCHDELQIWFWYRWQSLELPLEDYIILQQDTEKKFLYWVLIISVVMIPFWLAELFAPIKLTTYPPLYHAVNLGNALIWGIFVAEFVIMMSIVRKPLTYLAKHMLELIIIILPMFALVRFIRVASYAKILTLSKFQQLIVSQLIKFQRLLNLYRTRTVFNRLFRILILINVFRNWHLRHNPQKHLENLLEELKEKELEIVKLKQQIIETRLLIQKIEQKNK